MKTTNQDVKKQYALVYERKWYENGTWHSEVISKDRALDIALGTYRDNDMTRDMLLIPNRIKCIYSIIIVSLSDGNGNMITADPKGYNIINPNHYYDESGNRL